MKVLATMHECESSLSQIKQNEVIQKKIEHTKISNLQIEKVDFNHLKIFQKELTELKKA